MKFNATLINLRELEHSIATSLQLDDAMENLQSKNVTLEHSTSVKCTDPELALYL